MDTWKVLRLKQEVCTRRSMWIATGAKSIGRQPTNFLRPKYVQNEVRCHVWTFLPIVSTRQHPGDCISRGRTHKPIDYAYRSTPLWSKLFSTSPVDPIKRIAHHIAHKTKQPLSILAKWLLINEPVEGFEPPTRLRILITNQAESTAIRHWQKPTIRFRIVMQK